MEKEKKFMIIGILILLITLVGAAGTYAWFTWSSTKTTNFKYKVLLNITSIADELKNSALKYKLISNNTIITEGNFKNIESINNLYEGELSKGNVSYTF